MSQTVIMLVVINLNLLNNHSISQTVNILTFINFALFIKESFKHPN